MKGIFDPYVSTVTFRPSAHRDTPPPQRHADVLNEWSLMPVMLLLSIWNTYLGNDLWKADVCTMLCCKYWNSLLFTGPTHVSEKSWLLSGLREDRCRTNFLRVTNFALKLMDIMLKSGIRMSIYVCYLSLPADDCQSALRMLPLGRLVSGSASAVAEFFRSYVMLHKPALNNEKQGGTV